MSNLKLLLISILFISCNNAEKSAQKAKTEIKTQHVADFIPDGFEIVAYENTPFKIMRDLNKDGVPDYIVLLASGEHTEDYSNAEIVKVSIFEGQNDGSYQLARQTGNLSSAFLHTISDDIIEVVDVNVIRLKHQSMRHDYELKFRYESSYKNYMLIGSEYNNYGNALQDGAGNISSNFLAGKRLSTFDGQKTINLDKNLQPISAINDTSIYEFISK